MTKMIDINRQNSWLRSISQAAEAQHLSLPRITGLAMGSGRTATGSNGRFVTFKRRLVPDAQAELDGVEWGLWIDREEMPTRIAAFRESAVPTPQNVAVVLSLLRGWLLDEWTTEQAKAAVSAHPRSQPVEQSRLPTR
jgi:hypothetical protein